jgi:methylenetetrahydrofolate dehydrogenase (NADP+)/methenyltetrahydrofolate cyclohydrolase
MIIDGKAIAAKVRGEVAQAVKELHAKGVHPGLTVVRVGDDPASAIYVRGKRKDCEEVGIRSDEHHLPTTTSQPELMALVAPSTRGRTPTGSTPSTWARCPSGSRGRRAPARPPG